MRKKTFSYVADTIFWYVLYFLPIIAYLLYLFAEPASGATVLNLGAFMESSGFILAENNVIYTALQGVLGANGVLPLFASGGALMFLSYFCAVYLAHLVVDVLVFIPRLCHKWLNSFTKECE